MTRALVVPIQFRLGSIINYYRRIRASTRSFQGERKACLHAVHREGPSSPTADGTVSSARQSRHGVWRRRVRSHVSRRLWRQLP